MDSLIGHNLLRKPPSPTNAVHNDQFPNVLNKANDSFCKHTKSLIGHNLLKKPPLPPKPKKRGKNHQYSLYVDHYVRNLKRNMEYQSLKAMTEETIVKDFPSNRDFSCLKYTWYTSYLICNQDTIIIKQLSLRTRE